MSDWNQDQAAGEIWARQVAKQQKDDEGKAELADELRELLSAFIDARALRGSAITDEQWRRACLLCGRWCPPFVDITIREDEANDTLEPRVHVEVNHITGERIYGRK